MPASTKKIEEAEPQLKLETMRASIYEILETQQPDFMMEEILAQGAQVLGADAGTIMLWESDIGFFNTTYNIDLNPPLKGLIITPAQGGLDGKLYRDRDKRIAILSNYSKNMEVFPPLKPANFQFALGIALYYQKQFLATLCFYFRSRTNRPDNAEEKVLIEVGALTAIAVINSRLFQRLDERIKQHEETRNLMNLVLNASADIIINTDLTGKVKYWNKAAELCIGFTPNEVMDQKLPLIEGENEENFYQSFTAVRKEGKAVLGQQFTFRIKTAKAAKNSTIIKIGITPIFNQQNVVESILITGQDISEKQTLIRQVQDSNIALMQKDQELTTSQQKIQKIQDDLMVAEKLALIGQIADKLSHQINNPLMAILNAAQILQEDLQTIQTITTKTDVADPVLNSDLTKSCNDVLHDGERIKHVLKELKQFSDYSKETHYRPTDLLEAVTQVMTEYKPNFSSADIKITKKIESRTNSGEIFKINGNFGLLQQVFRILFENAIISIQQKAGHPEERAIRVIIERIQVNSAPYVRVSISDTGIGMDETQVSTLFTPFVSNWPNQGENEVHVGLNLAIVRLILQNHKAIISVKSKLEKGTNFLMDFPEI